MRNFGLWSVVTALVLVVFGFAIYPPGESLKLGKDLRGGVTLVYGVQVAPGVNADEAIGKTIEVLKQRVDPQGLFEIQMVAQGKDRIEVSMPLPGPEVQEMRRKFDEALEAVGERSITVGDFERIVRMEQAEREAALESVAGGNAGRLDGLREAVRLYDEAAAVRADYDEAQNSGASDEVLDELAGQVAEAEIAYESARNEAVGGALDPQTLRRALEASTDTRRIRSESGEEGVEELPSDQERQLGEIRENHPELTDEIDAAVQAFEEYSGVRKSLDDPADLKRRLAGAGVLSFRIAVDSLGSGGGATYADEQRLRDQFRESGPGNARDRDVAWYKINDVYNVMNLNSRQAVDSFFASPAAFSAGRGRVVEPYQNEFYMLMWDARNMRLTQQDGAWGLTRAARTTDELGKPAVTFNMNPQGAIKLGELTRDNVSNPLAILLDDQVYSVANIQQRLSNSVRITGDFSESEINYIIRTLNAGSLQARLSPEPLSEITIAPSLGADNLRAGLRAGLIALAVVSAFMVFYYFGYGMVSVISLMANALCILGAMALAGASFSLPGIAGVILTFGMAVDANVLIYERVREELRAGKDLRVAVKLGFEKALSSIVDGNVTNLIVCVVLAYTGTQEIKGFATTLGIGVVSTMFSALVISRLLFTLLVDRVKVRKLSMLPMAVPAVERVLEPKINWLGLRPFFVLISICTVGLGVVMIASRGEKMLDTEFRGGTQVDFRLQHSDLDDPTGGRIKLERSVVEERVKGIAEGLGDEDGLGPLRNATVLALEPDPDGVTSDQFRVKTYATDTEAVLSSIVEAFPEIDARPALTFGGSQARTRGDAPVYPITSARLGESVGRPALNAIDSRAYIGGVAIILEDLSPRPTFVALEGRLERLRGNDVYSGTLSREREIVLLEGTDEAVESVAILINDPGLSYLNARERWGREVADTEWRLISEALTEASTNASVQSFSPVIADDFRAQAVVAALLSFFLILIYIWVRFGSVRYSLAAIACLLHDVLSVLGLIALAEIIYDAHVLEGVATALLIEPFKIDLNLVAALLTIVGYSLNDTIIIMDRIRENRGKLPYASKRVVNLSINQTISRTVITSGTTLLAVLILYVYGGGGVHAFAFALLVGVLVGTYSSIAVAAPLVWSRRSDKSG